MHAREKCEREREREFWRWRTITCVSRWKREKGRVPEGPQLERKAARGGAERMVKPRRLAVAERPGGKGVVQDAGHRL